MVDPQMQAPDQYVEKMRAARNGSSVLKLNLVSLRSSLPKVPIFAFEGKDDKAVYFHWTRRVRNDLDYHPFPCDGKEQVLQLRDIVERDMSGLSHGVYFFVDRDFDDLRGRTASGNTFMTDSYAIENYLVDECVLNELLKNEFNCHLAIAQAVEVKGIFKAVYEKFLGLTYDINLYLYVVRRLGVKLIAPLPDKITKVVEVLIDDVKLKNFDIDALIRTERKILMEEVEEFRAQFNELSPASRYRGKFAMMFFMKWLEELAIDYNGENPKLFKKIPNTKVHYQKITIDTLACKSILPAGFVDFVLGVQPVRH